MSEQKSYFAELYRGNNGNQIEGVMLEEWDGQLDEATETWLESQGWGSDNPDLWVNIVEAETWAPNNHPIAQISFTAA